MLRTAPSHSESHGIQSQRSFHGGAPSGRRHQAAVHIVHGIPAIVLHTARGGEVPLGGGQRLQGSGSSQRPRPRLLQCASPHKHWPPLASATAAP